MSIKRRGLLAFACGCMLAVSAFGAAPSGAPTVADPEAWKGLTADAIERVKKGEIVIANTRTDVEGAGGQALITAAMIFDVDIAETFRIIRETEKQCEYLESCYKATLVERTDTYDIVEFTVKILAWNIKYRVKHQWDNSKYQQWWNLDPDFNNDLKHLEGYWHLYYMDDNHTLGRFGTRLIVKDFIPKSVQDALTVRDLPASLDQYRKRINSRGTYKKKGA